jgi:hypothetical protein
MRDGFIDLQRTQIASVWRASRAEDIVEMLDRAAIRTSMILDKQEPEVRRRILDAMVKAFRPFETETGLVMACPSVLATGMKRDAASERCARPIIS